MTDSIVGTLINLGMVDDLKALLALAKAGVINRDVDTTKLILQTIKTKFGKMDELQTNKEIKELIRELIDLLEVVDELIEEDEDVFAESAEEETVTVIQGQYMRSDIKTILREVETPEELNEIKADVVDYVETRIPFLVIVAENKELKERIAELEAQLEDAQTAPNLEEVTSQK